MNDYLNELCNKAVNFKKLTNNVVVIPMKKSLIIFTDYFKLDWVSYVKNKPLKNYKI
jgi:hypothetical protein